MYWHFKAKTPSQSEIFFQSYSLACSLCWCVCIGLHVKRSRFMCGSRTTGKTCGSCAGFQCKIYRFQVGLLRMSQFPVISQAMCFTWNAICYAVLYSCTWTMHVTVCAVGLQWHKMSTKRLDHPRRSLLTTAGERIIQISQVAISLLLLSCHPIMWMYLSQISL